MKRFSAFILIFAMCFSVLLTGCVDIWEGIEGDERVYEIHDAVDDINSSFSSHYYTWAVKLKRDNTVELIKGGFDSWRSVSHLGDEYADYNAQFKSSNGVYYGTYKQIGNRLKITFAPYKQYCRIEELSGEDAEAFKTAYIENNPDKAEIFGKGYVSQDDFVGKVLTLLVTGNECKPLKFVTEVAGGQEETWTYYSSGKIKSYKTDGYSKVIYKYNTDGSYTETVYLNGVIYRYRKADSHGNFTVQRSYDSDGKLMQESTYRYEYDSNGNCTARRSYDSDGKLKYEEQYEYDSNGNCTAEREYDSRGKLTNEKLSEYDSNGNCTAEREYDSSGKLTKEKLSEYDSNGNTTAYREYDSEGKLIFEWTR